jgi:predicted NBD/HSP70 family sugar kinase
VTGSGATPRTLRELNAQTVLAALVAEHPTSRAELARVTGMGKPTVGHALEMLLAAGLVRQVSPPGERHFGAVYFEPADSIGHVLAVDIGGRFVRAAVADLAGTMVVRRDLRLPDSRPQTVLELVARARDEVATGVDLVGCVVGVPGAVQPRTGTIHLAGPPELEGFPIVAAVGELVDCPVQAENDVNLAALGERWRGAGRGVDDFAFLFVGTGVGAGLVLRGELHRGFRGAAGEIDLPGPGGTPAPRSPAADAFTALAERVLGRPATPEEVFAAAGAGDPVAGSLINEEVSRIAAHIAPLALVLDVELVVLGGGIGLGAAHLLRPVRDAVSALVPYPPRIEVAQLGDAAVLAGAVAVGVTTARPAVIAARLRAAGQPGGLAGPSAIPS